MACSHGEGGEWREAHSKLPRVPLPSQSFLVLPFCLPHSPACRGERRVGEEKRENQHLRGGKDQEFRISFSYIAGSTPA